ncbi:hypothetical protein SBI_09743 [Streptomyces bingchenggensis BCW-1]|uniref:Uncharacterized protein n=1 Tax=Streptomyces bingchenggensis (strain BCW-1) TaxID=749414 RepID=D7CBI4_STRBB|nr:MULTISPECIES: hypothetical protein [Streptomyces]ADI12861.1 hypothetical protein SBI_09743 [Streptomyces bingchenggensis BCW-1]
MDTAGLVRGIISMAIPAICLAALDAADSVFWPGIGDLQPYPITESVAKLKRNNGIPC